MKKAVCLAEMIKCWTDLIITILFHWYISDISNLTSLSDIFNITMKLSQIKNCIGFKDYDHVMIFAIKNFTFVMVLIIIPLKSKSLFESKLKHLNQKIGTVDET